MLVLGAAVTVRRENSNALGAGFRCGFLGLLHMDVSARGLARCVLQPVRRVHARPAPSTAPACRACCRSRQGGHHSRPCAHSYPRLPACLPARAGLPPAAGAGARRQRDCDVAHRALPRHAAGRAGAGAAEPRRVSAEHQGGGRYGAACSARVTCGGWGCSNTKVAAGKLLQRQAPAPTGCPPPAEASAPHPSARLLQCGSPQWRPQW